MTAVNRDARTFGAVAATRHAVGWRVVGAVGLAAALVWAGWALLGGIAREPIHRVRAFAGTVTTLDVQASNGSVTVVAGAGSGATVTATGDRGLTTPSDDETLAGGTLQLRSGCSLQVNNDWCRLSYRVTVPAGVAVIAHSGGDSVTVRGITGVVDASTGNGTVLLEGLTATVTAHAGNGSVIGNELSGSTVQASSGHGRVSLTFDATPDHVVARSGHGSVTVTVPAGSGPYRVTGGSGSHIEIPTNPSAPRTIDAASGHGSVTLRTG